MFVEQFAKSKNIEVLRSQQGHQPLWLQIDMILETEFKTHSQIRQYKNRGHFQDMLNYSEYKRSKDLKIFGKYHRVYI